MKNFTAHSRALVNFLVDLVFPPLCLICGKLMPNADHICTACLDDFEMQEHAVKTFSISGDIHINRAWALFDFDEAFQSLVHHLKYSRKRMPVIRVLEYYESKIMDHIKNPVYDWVVPVPLHPRKQRERGYNQTMQICEWFAPRVNARMGASLVERITYSQSQTKLNAIQRERNVRKAFRFSGSDSLHGASILIIDDVLTTGATSNALACELLNNGAGCVDLITLSSPK